MSTQKSKTRKERKKNKTKSLQNLPQRGISIVFEYARRILNLVTAVGFIVNLATLVERRLPLLYISIGVSILAVLALFVERKYSAFSSRLEVYQKILSGVRKRIDVKDRSVPGAMTATAFAAFARRKAKQRNFATIVLLLSLVVHGVVVLFFKWEPSLGVVTVLVGAGLLLQAGEAAMNYRIRHGLYGTNEYEARQMVIFLINNAESSDLAGGLGAGDLEIDSATEKILQYNWGIATV